MSYIRIHIHTQMNRRVTFFFFLFFSFFFGGGLFFFYYYCSNHSLDTSNVLVVVLGQLPTKDNSPPDKNKAQPLLTEATILGLFPTKTTPH